MHIPENYLSPTTCAAMGAVMLPIWYKAVKEVKVKVDTDKKTIPMLGIGTSSPRWNECPCCWGSVNCYIVRTLGFLFSS